MSKVSELAALLQSTPSGPLVGEMRVKVFELLKECWPELLDRPTVKWSSGRSNVMRDQQT